MHFATWEPVYRAICSDFGFDRTADERARDDLAALTTPFDRSRVSFLDGVRVAVAGAAPSLADELDRVMSAGAVIAASGAADVLLEADVGVDLMTTDLDTNPGTALAIAEEGVPVAVHAHGDNRAAVREFVPRFDGTNVLPTTQAEPRGPVENFGGFTDGDRGAFLADHFDAGRLTFPGWDFDDPTVGPEKHHKLEWAERLLYWLEIRRDERFAVLDGRRDAIDTTGLPI